MLATSRSFFAFHTCKNTTIARISPRLPFDISLYLVANRPSFANEQQFYNTIMQAVKGGVTCVQLRDHEGDFPSVLKTALHLKTLLQPARVPLILNTLNLLDMAQAVHPEGLYLENPAPICEIRNQWGEGISIGIPAKEMSNLLSAGHKLHYVSVKVFASKKTCQRNDDIWGVSGLKKILENVPCPVVAIGGLNIDLVESIYKELRVNDGIAMAGGLMGQADPCHTATTIIETLQRVRGDK